MASFTKRPAQALWQRVPIRARTVFRAWQNAPVFPKELQIEPTNQCNLKCVMCPHSVVSPPPRDRMALEVFDRVLREFDSLNSVFIQGLGEPLLHKDLCAMIEHAKQRGFETSFITNMTVMTERMAERLVEAGHDYIFASIDSLDPAIVASIRRGAPFDVLSRVLKNLDRIREVRDRLGSDKPVIEVFSILMQHALPGLPDFVRGLKALGIRKVSFQDLVAGMDPEERLLNGRRFVDEPISGLPREQQREVLALIQGLNDDEIEVVPPHYLEMLDGPRDHFGGIATCLDLWERPMIMVDGTVKPCCHAVLHPDLDMGNIHEQSFRQIWFGTRYQELRLQHLTNRRPSLCRDCLELYQVLEPPPSGLERMKAQGMRPYPNTFLGSRSYSFGRGMGEKMRRFAARRLPGRRDPA